MCGGGRLHDRAGRSAGSPHRRCESPLSAPALPAGGEIWEELGTERARREMAEERRRREEAERERDDLRRELYARREPRESPEPSKEQQDRGQSHSGAPGAQEAIRRPWWRRVFRG